MALYSKKQEKIKYYLSISAGGKLLKKISKREDVNLKRNLKDIVIIVILSFINNNIAVYQCLSNFF